MKKRILFDVDGVLGDMLEQALLIINNINGYDTAVKDVTAWEFDTLIKPDMDAVERKILVDFFWKRMEAPGFVRGIRPYPEAQKYVAVIRECHEVYIVTSYVKSSTTWVYDRDRWLMEHFNIPRRKIIHTAAKYVTTGNIFVDDKVSNVLDWAEHNTFCTGVIWDQPYNRELTAKEQSKLSELKNVIRLDSWTKLIKLIEGP